MMSKKESWFIIHPVCYIALYYYSLVSFLQTDHNRSPVVVWPSAVSFGNQMSPRLIPLSPLLLLSNEVCVGKTWNQAPEGSKQCSIITMMLPGFDWIIIINLFSLFWSPLCLHFPALPGRTRQTQSPGLWFPVVWMLYLLSYFLSSHTQVIEINNLCVLSFHNRYVENWCVSLLNFAMSSHLYATWSYQITIKKQMKSLYCALFINLCTPYSCIGVNSAVSFHHQFCWHSIIMLLVYYGRLLRVYGY